MALSDHVSFADIEREYGLAEKQVKALMRDTLKPDSNLASRKRVRDFSDRRALHKQRYSKFGIDPGIGAFLTLAAVP